MIAPPHPPRRAGACHAGEEPGGLPLSSCGSAHERRFLARRSAGGRSEEHTSELQSRFDLVCRLLLEKKKHSIAPQCHSRKNDDAACAYTPPSILLYHSYDPSV